MTQKPDTCPICGATWLGEEIPPDLRHHYASVTHFRRTICIYEPIADTCFLYACPDCKSVFKRHSDILVPGAKLDDF